MIKIFVFAKIAVFRDSISKPTIVKYKLFKENNDSKRKQKRQLVKLTFSIKHNGGVNSIKGIDRSIVNLSTASKNMVCHVC